MQSCLELMPTEELPDACPPIDVTRFPPRSAFPLQLLSYSRVSLTVLAAETMGWR
uniref:Uncharacterized protein n=1 Tax=Oryza brachyantha TaxID=4533 RepID=J3LXN4_ORYBR